MGIGNEAFSRSLTYMFDPISVQYDHLVLHYCPNQQLPLLILSDELKNNVLDAF